MIVIYKNRNLYRYEVAKMAGNIPGHFESAQRETESRYLQIFAGNAIIATNSGNDSELVGRRLWIIFPEVWKAG